MILNNIDNLIHITENIATETSEQIAKTGLHALGGNIRTALSNVVHGFRYNKDLERFNMHKDINQHSHSEHERDLMLYHGTRIHPIKYEIKVLDDQIENETDKVKLEQLKSKRTKLNHELDINNSDYNGKMTRQQPNEELDKYARGYRDYNAADREISRINDETAQIRDSKSFKTGQFIANHEKAIGLGAKLTTGGVIGTTVNKVLHRKESKENDSSTDK